MTEDPRDRPDLRVYVDDDWKARVQAEKEELERRRREKPPEAASHPQSEGPVPPATLEVLVSTLGMQAMMAMGLMPNPIDGKAEIHLDQAKHFIDTIAMLEQKTQGNRTSEETAVFDDLLHELRMSYLALEEKLGKG